ncbi:TolC family outer membrane protein [Luteimonas sp. BDR2-5]|uniref:TolC family outer membrane protein n=1 Tax=Proluteimonas luteida TaxID=2878685 RepID=UPI001E4AADCA|nr:TolC family outer membrane protein [Luteimonas sp. BDR2-5]MCD9029699.1 TolC family outer membrane protein [Luteimonas sp. BDR2-5]
MFRRPLFLSLALALTSSPLLAADLVQTYELARTNDPTLSIAESQRLSTREGAVQARAALLPQINGSASLTDSRAAGVSGYGRTRSTGVNLGQTLFDWGQISTLRSQRALSTAADFQLEADNDSLITRTAAAYFDVLIATETLAAAEAAEVAFRRQFDFADKRLEVGLAPITDVHEARAQYDSARANTLVQRNALQDAYQALAEITGTPISNLRGLPDDFTPQLPEGRDAEAWVATALDQNPQLKALEYQVTSAGHNVTAAKSGHLPTLDLGASYGRSDSWGELSQGTQQRESETNSIGLTLTVPIFSGGATQSRVRQAIAQRDIAADQFEAQRRAIERNTRSAYQNLVAGITEVEARRLALVSANAAYEASQVGLEVGTRTVIDVLINQQTLFSARQQYAYAKYNFLQSRLLLEQAAGTLDISNLQDVNRQLTVDVDGISASTGTVDGTLPQQ